MTPCRSTTCGQCWFFGPLPSDPEQAEGYCGKVLPQAKPFPAVDDEGKPSSLTVTVRPIVRADDPGCGEWRALSGVVVAGPVGGQQATTTAADWRCKTYHCGGVPDEPGGLCERCLAEANDPESWISNDAQ